MKLTITLITVSAAVLGAAAIAAATPGVHSVPAIRLHTLTSPNGTFTLQAPAGWTFRADGAADASIAVAPSGRGIPAAFIWGLIPVNQIAAGLAVSDPYGDPNGWVRAQFQAMERQESAAEAVQGFAAAINRGLVPQLGMSNMRIVSLVSRSKNVAEVRVRYLFRGAPIDEHSFVRLVYYLNQAYSAVAGRPMWDTFAFAAGCSAPAGTLASTERPCAEVLRSFRPGANWLRNELVNYFQNQQTQMGMVQQTVNRIFQMQNQVAAEMRETTFKVGVDWTKTLGASVGLVDPKTGDHFDVWDNTWNWYCVPPSGRGVFGTDSPSVVASPMCDRELKRAP